MKKLKTKGLIKTLGAVGLAGILAFGAGIFVGCNKTPDDQTKDPPVIVDPIKPDPSDALNQAKEEYNNLASEIANAQSLRVHTRNHQTQEIIKIEIDGKKMQRTETENNGSSFNDPSFIQTTDGQTFEYTLKEDGYHKQVYTGSMTADITKASVVEMLGDITWTAIHNKALSGTKADQRIVATYNYDAKNLTLMSDEYTVTIDNLNNTQVTLPEVAVDETQIQEEFDPEKNIQGILENVKPILTQVEQAIFGFNTTVEITKFYGVYLKSSDGTTLDTIGALFNLKEKNTEYLRVTEVKLPVEDLTYEKIYNGLGNFKTSQLKPNQFFSTPISQGNLTNLQENRCKIVFGEDYAKDADCYSYNENRGANWDGYTLIKLKDGLISTDHYAVRVFNTGSVDEALEKYFIDQPSSDNTWTSSKQTNFDINQQTNVLMINIDNSTENTELDR